MPQTAEKPKYLVQPTKGWRGTIGERFSPSEFHTYLAAMEFSEWKPSFMVLHNTAAPDHAQWDKSIHGDKAHDVLQRLRNITADYRKKSPPWLGGPHLFIDWEGIWMFTPLWKQGTHSPSWNRMSWGIEMVGDYEKEPFDSGDGAKVRDNAVAAIAAMHQKLGIKTCTNSTLRLHREDTATNHACPGKNVKKADFMARVNTLLHLS